ncbi:unnamed protein product [Lota lota]
MAVNNLWVLCLLSLALCGPSKQEKPVSVELSCGAGPLQVVLEPDARLLLDCSLGSSEMPFNVTWLREGRPLAPDHGDHRDHRDHRQQLPNGSLLLSPVAPDVEGGYSCMSSSALGTLTSRTLTVLLANLSEFHMDPQPQRVPVGGAARFECQIKGVPTPVITWEKDQEPVPQETRFVSLPNGVLQILEVTEGDGGPYRCVASNSVGRRPSGEAVLTVTTDSTQALSKVVIVARPQNATVVLGRPAVMECMAQGQPKPLVSWSRQDGKPISTDLVVLATNLVIRDTRRHHAGVYVCRANRPKTREFVIAAAELHVPAPPVILQPPEAVSLSRGNTARFICNSSGEPPPTLHWLRNGRPIRSFRRVKTQSPGILLINQLAVEDTGYYQCIADNSVGTACATAKLTVIVREGLPSSPRHLLAVPSSSTTVLLTWERPQHNFDQVIGYSVHYQCVAGSYNVEYQFVVSNNTVEYQVKELLPHTEYTFYVVAYSLLGASSPSNSMTVKMLEDVPSTAPQMSIASISPTDIRLTWTPLSPVQSRGVVTGYRIEYSALDPAGRVFREEVGGNETHVTLGGLQPNQAYRLRMAASTRAGLGVPSEWAHQQTLAHYNHSMVVFTPTDLKVRARSNTLNVTWQPSPNHTQIFGYKLSYREVEAEELANGDKAKVAHTIKLRKKNRHHLLTGLAPDSQYEVRVWAYNKQAEGAAATWTGRTEKDRDKPSPPPLGIPPPLPPSVVQATANSSSSIWLRWEKPRFSSVRIINYTVRCSAAGTTNASLVSYVTSSAQEVLLGALKPFTLYELAVQSNGVGVAGPFSATVEEWTLSDRPSTPPQDVQLNALDSSSVLVRWRPPLEANGMIVGYVILYSSNLSQPQHLWTNLSQDGTITSVEVQGLSSDTRYFFKMGASTKMGDGPYSPLKDVHTPSLNYELDIHAVTGIIVGVCLGLLCVLLCMCFSFRNGKTREVSGGLDSTSASPRCRRLGRPPPATEPECTDSHELETLMPPSGQQGAGGPLDGAPEEQGLMAGLDPGGAGGHPMSEPKVTWNGSVSRNWANRITRYRETMTEDSPILINGALKILPNENNKAPDDLLSSSVCSNTVEAQVIVHLELDDPDKEKRRQARSEEEEEEEEENEEEYSPPSPPTPHTGGEDALLAHSLAQCSSPPALDTSVANHNGETERGSSHADTQLHQGEGLTNGFHSPRTPPQQPAVKLEPLENGAHRHRSPAPTKGLSSGLALSPAPFVHSTSTEHSYLCP